MDMFSSMIDKIMGEMSQANKEALMDRVMDKFFAGMTVDDKKKLMLTMTHKMMQGGQVPFRCSPRNGIRPFDLGIGIAASGPEGP